LDFDGKIGRVSDQILEPGRVSAVDAIVYDTSTDIEELSSDDGLFSSTPSTPSTPEKIEKVIASTKTDKTKNDENDLFEEAPVDVSEDDINKLEESVKETKEEPKKDRNDLDEWL